MSYWIFVVKDQEAIGLSADDVLSQRLTDQFWGLGERTPNRGALQQGDQVVFYMTNPVKSFVASATLAGPSFELSQEQQNQLSHDLDFYRTQFGVRLTSIDRWNRRKPVESLITSLDFITNKNSWGVSFMGGVRGIEEKDYRTIIQGDLLAAPARPSVVEVERESEFALENHLEDFLDQNWNSIDFGSSLERYATEGQNGRQFSAGSWNIDFLCVDKNSGDFVVLELKRGKTSDAAVGQILRYMGWVRKNLPGKSVRGIIIAKEADEALRYAIEDLPNIKMLEYHVDFKLTPPSR